MIPGLSELQKATICYLILFYSTSLIFLTLSNSTISEEKFLSGPISILKMKNFEHIIQFDLEAF
jgi:hypothetical protein